jgi:hypothetical protein
MNENELELLLREQVELEDNGFSAGVIKSLPRRGSEKVRLLVLFSFTTLGSLGALFFMGGSSSEFFTEIFNGFSTYNPAGLGVALAVVMLYATLFLTTSEELA